MPNYIVKPDAAEDFYVLWSEIVDAPLAWGPRTWLMTEYHRDPSSVAAERFDRADQNGSSAKPQSEVQGFYWWDDDTFVYHQEGILRRPNVKTLCDRLERDEPVDDLLEPFDD